MNRTFLCVWLACGFIAAQTHVPAPPPDQEGELLFRSQVKVVIAPTTVTDSEGRFISNLRPDEFLLYDNDKLQTINQEIEVQPLSLAVVIQANNNVEKVLPSIQRIGPLLSQLVVGKDGEIAILSFDSRVRLRQDFTNDPDMIDKALKGIVSSYSQWAVQQDAVMEASRMLRRRPDNRRKVILLISETRGQGNTTRLRDVLLSVQFGNIDVYTVNINRLVTSLTARPTLPRPDPIPPAARPMPPGVSRDPTTIAQVTGAPGDSANLVPIVKEIMKGVAGLFVDNPAEFLTKYTGGREFAYTTYRDLERAISLLGEELHSQYLLSYSPNNKEEGGFHTIRVVVKRPGLKVRTRPGYWMAAVPE